MPGCSGDTPGLAAGTNNGVSRPLAKIFSRRDGAHRPAPSAGLAREHVPGGRRGGAARAGHRPAEDGSEEDQLHRGDHADDGDEDPQRERR